MGLHKFRIAAILFMVVCLFSIALAGSWNCQFGSNKGKVDSLTVDLGTVLWADGDYGKKTTVSLPTQFDHYNGIVNTGTVNKSQITSPSGNFVVKVTARFAGNRNMRVWWSKRNVLKVEVHDGDASGAVLAEGTLDKNVSSPSNYTLTLPQVTAGLQTGNGKQYTIKLIYDKYDNDGNDDGSCGLTITVTAE